MLAASLLLALAAPTTTAAYGYGYAYPNPGACSGICGNAHDPSIIRRSDGTYFRFSTGGLVPIHTAPAITGPWTFACNMLSTHAKVKTPGNPGTELWAPDVALVGSTYYVYYAVSTFGTRNSAIGVATSPSLDCGTFTDHGATGVASSSRKPYNAIDPHLFNDGGIYRLSFGSYWHNIYQVTMADPPTKASGSSVQIAYEPVGIHSQEATSLIKHGHYYYLFTSKGQCCGYDFLPPRGGEEYRITVCRSTSANSGFVDARGVSCLDGGGTTVLASHGVIFGPGGQSFYEDAVDGLVMVYHYVNTTVGPSDGDKLFGWNRIVFNDGWPTVAPEV